jgi:metal-responsive CopG/Arc/MetJ family transcriptional regulator
MASQVAKLTISMPRDLIALADEVASEKRTSRSKVIAACLQELAERRLRAEMEEGYKVMAKEQREFANMTFELQRRVVPKWE